MEWGFANVDPPDDEIVSFATVGNLKSRRVMEKIGMIRDVEGDFDHPLLPDWVDRRHVLYRIDRRPIRRGTWHDRAVALITLLHGPNLNLLGQREPEIYGTATLDDYVAFTTDGGQEFGHEVDAFQTNHEGELVDAIHDAREHVGGDHHQPRRLHPLRVEHPRRARRVQRPDRRGAHLEPERPRAVAAHQRHRAGRDRLDHGFRHAGLRLAVEAVAAKLSLP